MTVSILVGDVRERLMDIPERSVQCVVTSPPYFGLRSYLPDGHEGKAKEIGTEQTPDAYVAEMVAVFREVRRVLRDDGTLWLNLGDSYAGGGTIGRNDTTPEALTQRAAKYGTGQGAGSAVGAQGQRKPASGHKQKDLLGIPWLVAFALRADGWYLRSEIIWAKPNPMPESVTDRPTKAHEQVFLLSKQARYFYDAKAVAEPASDTTGTVRFSTRRATGMSVDASGNEGRASSEQDARGDTRNRRSVWTIASQPYSGAHFATMPPDLAETCIKAGSSERGQCPTCGAPWVRQVETERVKDPTRHSGRAKVGCTDRQDGDMPRMLSTVTTTGWAQSCACPVHQPVPQMILDPFLGAGTTALVADRLQRNCTGVELNPTYAALARDRINSEAGLFAPAAE
jgi:DNA modification methylase